MLGLYRILCLDAVSDPPDLQEMKRKMFALIYMDNGAYTGSEDEIRKFYSKLDSVFNPYQFGVQQVMTSVDNLQNDIDQERETETLDSPKLLGLTWHRKSDEISPRPVDLNKDANTKRKILKSVASQYDPLNLQGPCLNRARLFLHRLQNDGGLGWDERLSSERTKEWTNIVKQANRSDPPRINRSMGSRDDPYEIVVFTDASKFIYAAVCYLKNRKTGEVSFLFAKYRVVNKQLEIKTIPTLELQAITLGVEIITDAQNELSGSQCILPVNIVKRTIYTDSTISIHWLNSQVVKLGKMQKLSVYVRNRLDFIERQCKDFPVGFRFVATNDNPADCLTRCLSSSMLKNSCYHHGPNFLKDSEHQPDLEVMIPNPEISSVSVSAATCVSEKKKFLIDITRFSQLRRLIAATGYVFKYIDRLRIKCGKNKQEKSATTYRTAAWRCLLQQEQQRHFPEVLEYLRSPSRRQRDIPELISQLNLFLDKDGIIRIKSKFGRWKDNPKFCFPALISYDSYLTKLLIRETHRKFLHSGIYSVLSEIRKHFFLFRSFSTVRKVLSECITCKRANARTIKLNQNSYRDSRVNPPNVPYQSIFIDHLGPFKVRRGSEVAKVWLLLVTCLWSRAVNLLVCNNLTTREFLAALQVHVLQEGLPAEVYSDLGSQMVSGSRAIKEFLSENSLQTFMKENGINIPKFHQYPKGNSALGSLVESCVKITKKAFYGSIKNNVLDIKDFHFFVQHRIHVINKRPISFREVLRENSPSRDLPEIITPELLVKGREVHSINIVPELHTGPLVSGASVPDGDSHSPMAVVRQRLAKIYDEQLRQTLLTQATDKKGRYKTVRHTALQPGDIVLLADPFLKQYNFPVAMVCSVEKNSIGEVTEVIVTRQHKHKLRRHVSSLILLLRPVPSAS